MLKTIEDWIRHAVNELFPFATMGLLYLLITVVAKASDQIISRLDASQRELEAIRESIKTMARRIPTR